MLDDVVISLKRLTKNDVSWIKPKSSSHQAGINLPKGGFSEMFSDIIAKEEENPRLSFNTFWYRQCGTLVTEKECEVIWYQKKKEFRLVHIPASKLTGIMKIYHLIIIRREEKQLHITPLSKDGEHLVNELGRSDLVQTLPRRSKKD